MGGLDRLAWRALVARPFRTGLTTLGIALGVAVLSASLATSAAMEAAVSRTVADLVGRADLRVSAFLERGLSPAAVDAIAGTDGVETLSPVLERRTFLGSTTGAAPGDAVTILAIDPASYTALHDLDLASGASLAEPGETAVLISETLAAADGYRLGSQLVLQGAGAPITVRVVGLLAGPGPLAGADGRTVVVPIDTAQAAFGTDAVSRIELGFADGVDAATIAARLATAITTEPYVLASPADLAASLRASTADFQSSTALVAAIVLFVGAFLIANTLSMTIGERAREVGLLRAAGATRRQVVRFVVAGAAMLGIAGAGLGMILGVGLGALMAGSVAELTGFAAAIGAPDPTAAAVAAIIGIAVTLLAAMEPAARAARISPAEALRARVRLPASRGARLAWLALVFVGVGAAAALVWPSDAGSAGSGRALVVYAVLLVATLVSPFLLQPLARIVGLPVAAVLRLEERLARGSLGRDRSRTALTVGALTVGLAMIVALGWAAQGARQAASAWLEDVVPGDVVVTSIRPIGPDEGIDATLAAIPGVVRVTPIATFDIAARGTRLDAAAVVGADLLADGRLTFIAGDRAIALRAIDAGGSIILPAAAAQRLGLTAGDRLTIALGGGSSVTLSVAGVVERSIPGSGGESALLGWADAAAAFGVTGTDVFAIRAADGRHAEVLASVREAATPLALEANPLERIQGAVSEALGRVFGLFDALALVAVLVATLGIVNTLTIGVVERIREIGVLRAIGMSRRQASRMIVVEAIVIGLAGAILGSLTGLGVGAVLLALGTGLTPAVGLPWTPILVALALGLAAPAIAAYSPSRLASGVSIVRALKFE